MSGGPDGGGGGGIGGGPDGYDCAKLRFEAQLTSPQPAAVAALAEGNVLDITIATMKGQVVVQVLKKDQVVGGLAGPDASRLRNCMEEGKRYIATVLVINGGQVRVLVERTL